MVNISVSVVVGDVLVVIAAALLIPVGPSLYGRERAYYNGSRFKRFGDFGPGYDRRYENDQYGPQRGRG